MQGRPMEYNLLRTECLKRTIELICEKLYSEFQFGTHHSYIAPDVELTVSAPTMDQIS